MIGVGFIGLGGMGSYQAKSFAKVKSCRIVAGSDPVAAAQQRFAEAHPGAVVVADYRELLANPAVDAVVIAVPTFNHREIAIAALKAGKPVLCEKPLARTVADCRQMIAVARKTRKLLMVAHCRRFDSNWGAFAKLVRQGKLGRPILWRHLTAGKGPGSWFVDDKLGGGPLLDGAVHDHDFGNYLFGEPVRVFARGIKLTKATAVDTASAIVEYKSGDQMVHSWSWGISGGSLLDALGPKGGYRFDAGNLPIPEQDKAGGKYGYHSFTGLEGAGQLVRFPVQDMYVNQAKHFLACVDGKATCLSSAEDAMLGVAVGDAIIRASRSASGVVRI